MIAVITNCFSVAPCVSVEATTLGTLWFVSINHPDNPPKEKIDGYDD